MSKFREKFQKNIIYSASSQLIVFALAFAYHIIISRHLGPSDLGIFTLLVLTPLLLGRFAHFGIDAASAFYVDSSQEMKNRVVTNCLVLNAAVFLCLSLAFIAYAHFFDGYIYQRYDLALAWALLAGTSVFRTLFFSILVGQNRLRLHSVLSVADSIAPLAFALLLLLVGSLTITTLLWAQIATGILVSLGLAVSVCKNFSFNFSTSFLKTSLSYGVKSWLNNIFNQLIYKVDLYIVGYFLTAADVGVYSIAVLVIEKAWYFSGSICNSLFPLVKNIEAKEGGKYVIKIVRMNLLFVSTICIILGIAAKPILELLFSTQYLGAVQPLILLIPGIIALSTPKILVAHLAAKNKMEYAATASGLALLCNIALNIVLVPRFGINGAAIASSVAYLIYWALYARFYKIVTGIDAFFVWPKKRPA